MEPLAGPEAALQPQQTKPSVLAGETAGDDML